MQCYNPPELTDDQISAILDGDTTAAVRHHLEHCAACAAQLAHSRRIEQGLRHTLRRWDCPTPQQLGDYVGGLIDRTILQALTSHLARCALCRQELDELQQFLGDDTPQRTPSRRWSLPNPGDLLALLLPRTPALALRGFASGPLMAEVGGTTVMLDIQTFNADQVLLIGQLVDDDQDHWTGAQVELSYADGLLQTEVDDLGGFRCGPLAAGTATLRITPASGPALVIAEVELQPSTDPLL